jgi:hypothetical protein
MNDYPYSTNPSAFNNAKDSINMQALNCVRKATFDSVGACHQW